MLSELLLFMICGENMGEIYEKFNSEALLLYLPRKQVPLDRW